MNEFDALLEAMENTDAGDKAWQTVIHGFCHLFFFNEAAEIAKARLENIMAETDSPMDMLRELQFLVEFVNHNV